jgi:hypothetical protein
MNNLDKWINLKKFNKSSKTMPTPSHHLFSGGNLYIPPGDMEYMYLCKYADEIDNGTKLYHVESRPKVFRYFLDIDIKDDHYWSSDEIINLTKFIQNVVKDFFDDNHSTICCVSSEKIKKDGIHTGFHLIWNDIFLSSETALIIRSGIIHKLKESDIKIDGDWEDTIDKVVYTRAGYRMVGSDKMIEGKAENRPLTLSFVMNFAGELRESHFKRLRENTKSLMLETSIRHIIDTFRKVGMKLKFPLWLSDDITKDIKVTDGTCNYSIATSREHMLIEKFIREKLPKVYSRCFIKEVKRYPDNNLLIIPNSKYCLNIEKQHNSCGVYFFASPNGVYQKCLCFCNKLEGRKKGYCKDYTSECFPFDETIRKILFPKFVGKKTNGVVILTKTNIERETLSLCDKLLKDIMT